jgi:hypothetical protein
MWRAVTVLLEDEDVLGEDVSGVSLPHATNTWRLEARAHLIGLRLLTISGFTPIAMHEESSANHFVGDSGRCLRPSVWHTDKAWVPGAVVTHI